MVFAPFSFKKVFIAMSLAISFLSENVAGGRANLAGLTVGSDDAVIADRDKERDVPVFSHEEIVNPVNRARDISKKSSTKCNTQFRWGRRQWAPCSGCSVHEWKMDCAGLKSEYKIAIKDIPKPIICKAID